MLLTVPTIDVARANADEPALDVLICGHGRPDPHITNETFEAWLQDHAPDRVASRRRFGSKTTVSDPISLDFSASRTFVGHIGGKGGSRALYDPVHRTLAVCQQYDSAAGFTLSSGVARPPFAVDSADLTQAATHKGIRIGSSVAEVRRLYGPASIAMLPNGQRGLYYERRPHVPGYTSEYSVLTWFGVANGEVITIGRLSGF